MDGLRILLELRVHDFQVFGRGLDNGGVTPVFKVLIRKWTFRRDPTGEGIEEWRRDCLVSRMEQTWGQRRLGVRVRGSLGVVGSSSEGERRGR